MAEDPLRTLRQEALDIFYFFSPRLVPLHIANSDTRAVIRSGHVIVENPQRRPRIELVSYSAFYTPVLLAALIGIYVRRRDRSRDAMLWCIVANFIAIHALYFPATRYRAPMEFVPLFYAAAALQHLLSTRWIAAIKPTRQRLSTSLSGDRRVVVESDFRVRSAAIGRLRSGLGSIRRDEVAGFD